MRRRQTDYVDLVLSGFYGSKCSATPMDASGLAKI